MKVKLIKHKNYYLLAVDDKEINQKYNCSQKEPVILASLDGWEGTKCWSVHDLRLSEYRPPSHYLEGNNIQYYTPETQEEEKLITSIIKNYKKRDDKIIWSTFSGVVGYGDKTHDPSVPEYVRANLQGCWSFNEGMKEFNLIRQFWEAFEGDDIASIKIHNPHTQPDSNIFIFFKALIEYLPEGQKREKAIKNWQKISHISDDIMNNIDFKKLYQSSEEMLENNKSKKKLV